MSDLERVIRLGVPHISAYALTIEPETPFARARARGKLALPDEDTLLAAGRRLRVGLAASGFTQYEISSFARPGHASRHNQRYWLRRDVLGIGVGAASLVESSRWKNLRARSEWEARLADGRLPVAESESLTEPAARRETLFLGFRRRAGISWAAYLRRFAEAPERRFGAEIRELRVAKPRKTTSWRRFDRPGSMPSKLSASSLSPGLVWDPGTPCKWARSLSRPMISCRWLSRPRARPSPRRFSSVMGFRLRTSSTLITRASK